MADQDKIRMTARPSPGATGRARPGELTDGDDALASGALAPRWWQVAAVLGAAAFLAYVVAYPLGEHRDGQRSAAHEADWQLRPSQ